MSIINQLDASLMLELMAKVREETEKMLADERANQWNLSRMLHHMKQCLVATDEKRLIRALAWGVLAYQRMHEPR